MDTNQLNHLLKDYKDCYVGAFPRDHLPKKSISKRPFALIMNTDVSNNPGEHWVALFVNKDNIAEYFDSFGRIPLFKEITEFMSLNKINKIIHNKKQVQNAMSSTCGIFSVLYIKLRCGGLSFEEFVKYFSENTIRNDIKAYVSLYL